MSEGVVMMSAHALRREVTSGNETPSAADVGASTPIAQGGTNMQHYLGILLAFAFITLFFAAIALVELLARVIEGSPL